MSEYTESNYIILRGKVTKEKEFNHEIYGEKFYIFEIAVPRLSDSVDIIPITISERLIGNIELNIGKEITVKGQFRSYNEYQKERNKLLLTVFAKELKETEENEEEIKKETLNEVKLTGYICKKPIYRKTPFGREIADLLLAVNRAYNKSDYIPCIAWGRNAKFCEEIEVGKQVRIYGRIQSRTYEKKFEDGTIEKRVAYEVSIAGMEIVKNNSEIENIEEKTETEEDTSEAI